ncbi:MAG TPA: cyclic nucleotide-gated ion channel [Stellaceae bacterium]|nr:cyclic nucleotide-gated ion channel [Stellaceae bacterium]
MGLDLEKLAEALDTTPQGPWARPVRLAHETAVAAGVAAIIAATEAGWPPPVAHGLAIIVWTLAVVFAVEYVLRLAIAPWAHWAHRNEPWRARWHWAVNFAGIVDLAGVYPLVTLALGVTPEKAQLWGAMWLLKLVPYAPGLDLVGRVLKNARRTLMGLLLGFVMVLVVAATLEYVFEGTAQPQTFGSVPRALWWGVSTLTTVGYGDEVPVTLLGRVLAGMVMLCGIGVCALWTAILVAGFSYEIRRSEFLRTWEFVARVPYFQNQNAAVIAEAAQMLRSSDVIAGEAIVRRGEPGDCMYFIVTGQVSVELKPQPRILGPGDFFGEMALITGEARTATAIALTNCELLHLDLADFLHLEARHPDLAKIIEAEAKRRREEPVRASL